LVRLIKARRERVPSGGLMEEFPPVRPIYFSYKRYPLVSLCEARIA